MLSITLNKEEIDAIDLEPSKSYIQGHENVKYFNLPAGQEHYKLLAYIANQLPKGSVVYDIGTYLGFSALAWSRNPNIKVVTYDIGNYIQNKEAFDGIINLERRIGNCIMDAEEIVERSKVIMIDVDPHDGIQEVAMLKAFVATGFKGIMLFDDIYANEPMYKFWQSINIPGTTKLDLTSVGHFSGTGAIVWDGVAEIKMNTPSL